MTTNPYAIAEEAGNGWNVPLENATFGVTDEADITWLSTRITAQPLRSFGEPVRLRDPALTLAAAMFCAARKNLRSFISLPNRRSATVGVTMS